jgi:hypothetical protein
MTPRKGCEEMSDECDGYKALADNLFSECLAAMGMPDEFSLLQVPYILRTMRAELAAMTADRDEMQQLFDLQHTRTVKADRLFQEANGVDYFPDLGNLIDWLITRYEKLEVSLALSVGGVLEPNSMVRQLAAMTADRDSEKRWADEYHRLAETYQARCELLKSALVSMVHQYLREDNDLDCEIFTHDFMSAGEETLELLVDIDEMEEFELTRFRFVRKATQP